MDDDVTKKAGIIPYALSAWRNTMRKICLLKHFQRLKNVELMKGKSINVKKSLRRNTSLLHYSVGQRRQNYRQNSLNVM